MWSEASKQGCLQEAGMGFLLEPEPEPMAVLT